MTPPRTMPSDAFTLPRLIYNKTNRDEIMQYTLESKRERTALMNS